MAPCESSGSGGAGVTVGRRTRARVRLRLSVWPSRLALETTDAKMPWPSSLSRASARCRGVMALCCQSSETSGSDARVRVVDGELARGADGLLRGLRELDAARGRHVGTVRASAIRIRSSR